jgi:hypothetical protein
MDDQKLTGNPYVGSFSKDDKDHVVRAEAPGFAPSTRSVRLMNDATYEFALSAVPTAAPVATAAAAVKDDKTRPGSGPARPGKPATPAKGTTPPALESDPWK